MTTKIEYRVREVKRYVVTRYRSEDEGPQQGGSVESKGEFDNENVAHEVAYALCREEHQRLGYPLDDERIQYPKRSAQMTASFNATNTAGVAAVAALG